MMALIGFQAFVDETQHVLAHGDAAQALQRAEHALRFYPEAIAAWYLLGEAQLAGGQTLAARASMQRVLSADPHHVGALIGLATSYERDGLSGYAVAVFEQVVELAPQANAVRQRLVTLYRQLDAEPTHLLSRAALAYLYLRADMPALAIDELRVLQATQPERHDLLVALAEALWRTNQHEAAAELCRAVLVQAPTALKPMIMLGQLLRSGDEGQREALWRKAQALDPCMHVAQMLLDAWHDPSPMTPTLPPWTPQATAPQPIPQAIAPQPMPQPTSQTSPAPSLDDEIHAILHWLDEIDQPKTSVVVLPTSARADAPAPPRQRVNHEDGALVIAGYLEQLRAEPHNTVLRLALARLGTRTGHYDLAFEQYEQLLAHRSYIEHMIDDLHELLGEQRVQHRLRLIQALLSQAYIAQGRYREALNLSV
jgi:tetratricopeptide (TPR) repeat protein